MTTTDEKFIPAFSAPNDIIRCGFRSLANETISTHPIDKLQENVTKILFYYRFVFYLIKI